jgi:hypothetical protein
MLDWQPIATAPFDRDLQVSVIERGEIHTLIFPCRRTQAGRIKIAADCGIGVRRSNRTLTRRFFVASVIMPSASRRIKIATDCGIGASPIESNAHRGIDRRVSGFRGARARSHAR